MSSAFGTLKTVEAKFWPWLERAILRVRFVKPLEVVPFFPSCDVSAAPPFGVEENSIWGSEIGF